MDGEEGFEMKRERERERKKGSSSSSSSGDTGILYGVDILDIVRV